MYDLVIEIGFIRLCLPSYQLSLIINNNNIILTHIYKPSTKLILYSLKFLCTILILN